MTPGGWSTPYSRKKRTDDVDPWGFVRLDSRILGHTMAKVTRASVTKHLVKGGVFEIAGHSKGIMARGFRLTEEYCSQALMKV
jgi:hypothetical protein